MTIVIVEHVFNLPHVLDLATAVWKLENGKLLVEDAAMVNAELRRSLDRSDRVWLEELASDRGSITDIELEGGAVLSIVSPHRVELGQPILEVQNLGVMRGKRQVLSNISFVLYAGQIAVFFAPNGYGKTSLLDAIAGLLPCSGKVLFNGKPIHRLTAWERVNRGISLMRARDNIFSHLKVREMLQLSGVADPPDNILPFLEKQVSALSGGERQRVVLACTHGRSSILQMMDEPFGALDAIGVKEVREMIEFGGQKAYLIALPANISGEKL